MKQAFCAINHELGSFASSLNRNECQFHSWTQTLSPTPKFSFPSPQPKDQTTVNVSPHWISQRREANGVICINGIALTVFLIGFLKFLI